MTIHGSIEDTGLADVLQLLAMGRKSGCLAVLDGELHGEVYLESGRISYATVDNRADRLGDILVKSGRITKEQLQVAVAAQKGVSRKPLGRALLDSGAIARAELEQFVRLQVQEAVYFLFTLKRGAFTFNPDRRPAHQFLTETLDADALLLEGARRVDEWSQIQKRIPSFDLVFRQARDVHAASADDLSDEQRRLLPLLDGSRDVSALVDATGMSEFDVGKALYGLVLPGLVQLLERRTHVRHLDYRELLAWVVREAEFADPQRRKDAGRHIVECPTCAERLRKIQARGPDAGTADADAAADVQAPPRVPRPVGYRASGAAPAVGNTPRPWAPRPVPRVSDARLVARPAALPAAAVAEPAVVTRRSPVAPPTAVRQSPSNGHAAMQSAPLQAAPQRSATLPPPPLAPRPHHDRRSLDRHAPDRRGSADRRHFERRAGLDRRAVVNASWGLYHEERRRGPRREDDQRPGHAAGRRSTDRERIGMLIGNAVLPARPAGPGERPTGPRRLIGAEMRGTDWSVRVPGDTRDRGSSAVAQAERRNVAAPPPPPPPPGPEAPPVRRPEPRVSRRVAPPKPAADPENPEFEWLVSPEESIELMWASRAQRKAREAAQLAAAGAAPAEPPSAPARQPAGPAAAAPPSAGIPVIPLRSAGPGRLAPSARPAAAAAPQPGPTSPTMGHLSWGDDVAQPAIAWPPPPPPESRLLPGRVLAVLAAVVLIGVLGYQAGRVGRRAPRADAAQPATPAPAATQERAAPPPETRAPETPAERPNAATPSPGIVRQPAAPVPAPGGAQQRSSAVPPAATPSRPTVAPPAARTAAAQPPAVVVPPVQRPAAAVQAPAAPAPQPVAAPAPTVGVLRGVVHDAGGAPIGRARVIVRGTSLAGVSDAAGVYEIRDVPDGAVSVQAAADGYQTATADARARAGGTVAVDLALARVPAPTAAAPDRELADGGWGPIERAEALTILGGTLGVIEGLAVESISKSMAATRQRVRVVQLTADGQRIVLTETRAGAAVTGAAGLARVTALRVMPPSEAFPFSTGTVSFGNIMISAKSPIAPDSLQAMLRRLAESR